MRFLRHCGDRDGLERGHERERGENVRRKQKCPFVLFLRSHSLLTLFIHMRRNIVTGAEDKGTLTARDSYGATPLHWAVWMGFSDVVDVGAQKCTEMLSVSSLFSFFHSP